MSCLVPITAIIINYNNNNNNTVPCPFGFLDIGIIKTESLEKITHICFHYQLEVENLFP